MGIRRDHLSNRWQHQQTVTQSSLPVGKLEIHEWKRRNDPNRESRYIKSFFYKMDKKELDMSNQVLSNAHKHTQNKKPILWLGVK